MAPPMLPDPMKPIFIGFVVCGVVWAPRVTAARARTTAATAATRREIKQAFVIMAPDSSAADRFGRESFPVVASIAIFGPTSKGAARGLRQEFGSQAVKTAHTPAPQPPATRTPKQRLIRSSLIG